MLLLEILKGRFPFELLCNYCKFGLEFRWKFLLAWRSLVFGQCFNAKIDLVQLGRKYEKNN